MNSVHRPPRFLQLEPYKGSTVDLVIGIDVGTTFSGVSYAVLQPNKVPEVQPVTRFSSQTTSDAKIPSIMYFDKKKELKATGASAITESTMQDALFEDWTKVEHFKMHLRPSKVRLETNGLVLCGLPATMTATEAMGHFLRYLYNETLNFITVYHANGADLLQKIGSRISFVLSHPNGWDGLPQQQLRQAAVFGGLIADDATGYDKIKFVTEGEASSLACLANGLCPPNLQPGYRFVIADAGGGTIDVTTYEITQIYPLRLKELTSSDGRFAGSVFVNVRAHELLKRKLSGTRFANADELNHLAHTVFEGSTKREFESPSRPIWMHIGPRSENDASRGIRKGALKFEGLGRDPALLSIFNFRDAGINQKPNYKPVWLVGGFGASPWLLKKLNDELKTDGITVSRPDTNLAKAVANGAVLHALDSTITGRVTRTTYGIEIAGKYDPYFSEHRRRQHLCFTDLDGTVRLASIFDVIVEKDVQVKEAQVFSRSYRRLVGLCRTPRFTESVLCYDGVLPAPIWYPENKESFFTVCHIESDLSSLCRSSSLRSYKGKQFWEFNFDIEILFGQTELKARVMWNEDGITRYGPTSIFYEDK